MDQFLTFIPIDRQIALVDFTPLRTQTYGAALFADLSGFTPLTEALVRALGPQRGAEELTHQLNRVYDALISQVENYRGTVIGFSGDAITCWFDASLTAPHVGVRTERVAGKWTSGWRGNGRAGGWIRGNVPGTKRRPRDGR